MILYDPTNNNKGDFPNNILPINSFDDMLSGFTFQYLIDAYTASVEEKSEETLQDFINELIDAALQELWTKYGLVADNLLQECRIAKKIFKVTWRIEVEGESTLQYGFVKAKDDENAERISQNILSDECEIIEVIESSETIITPSSTTLNFKNESQYHYGW